MSLFKKPTVKVVSDESPQTTAKLGGTHLLQVEFVDGLKAAVKSLIRAGVLTVEELVDMMETEREELFKICGKTTPSTQKTLIDRFKKSIENHRRSAMYPFGLAMNGAGPEGWPRVPAHKVLPDDLEGPEIDDLRKFRRTLLDIDELDSDKKKAVLDWANQHNVKVFQ